jgi:hypothetical protein
MMKTTSYYSLLIKFCLIVGASLRFIQPIHAAGSQVEITGSHEDGYHLVVNGDPFFICGAGGTSFLETLKESGGNSIRTWGIDSLDKMVDGKSLMDRAAELGLYVTAGIWLGHERHGFNYSDKKQLEDQREEVRAAVEKWKDHPALLMWGLGNEMEGPTSDGSDARIWKEVNHLAGIIKELDPDHPVMTAIAGAQDTKVQMMVKHCENIDVLGVNGYASAPGAGAAVVRNGWTKPFALTEFGPMGHWEVPKTPWGAPLEGSSSKKAASYFSTQKVVINDSRKICLGTYAFLWGNKQETTSTWYGMFLQDGTKLGQVDAMSYAWTGQWPENRSPVIKSVHSTLKEARVAPGSEHTVTVDAKDANGDPMEFEWLVMRESSDTKVGGDDESVPESFSKAVKSSNGNTATIETPRQSGAYRLFVTIRDGKNAGATDNLPFYVK